MVLVDRCRGRRAEIDRRLDEKRLHNRQGDKAGARDQTSQQRPLETADERPQQGIARGGLSMPLPVVRHVSLDPLRV
jgi:hypothetical protein